MVRPIEIGDRLVVGQLMVDVMYMVVLISFIQVEMILIMMQVVITNFNSIEIVMVI